MTENPLIRLLDVFSNFLPPLLGLSFCGRSHGTEGDSPDNEQERNAQCQEPTLMRLMVDERRDDRNWHYSYAKQQTSEDDQEDPVVRQDVAATG